MVDAPAATHRSIKVFFLMLAKSINAVTSFLFLPYLVRHTSYAQYATYGQVLLVGDLIKIALLSGMTQIIFVWYARHDDKSQVFTSNLVGLLLAGVVAVLVQMVAAAPIAAVVGDPQLVGFLRIYALSLLFQVPCAGLTSTLVYANRFARIGVIEVAFSLVRAGGIILALVAFDNFAWIFWSIVATSALNFVALYLSVPRALRGSSPDWRASLKQIKEGFPLGMSTVVAFVIATIDSFIVGAFLPKEQYAIYRNGAIDVPLLGTLCYSVTATILADIASHVAKGENQRILALKRSVVTATAALLYPVILFIIVYSDDLIRFYLSDRYLASGAVFAIYSCMLLLRISDYQDLLVVSGKARACLKINVAVLVLNMAACPFAVLNFGVRGAAAVAVASQFLTAVLLLRESARHFHVRMHQFFEIRNLLLVSGISLILPLALHRLTPEHASFWWLAGVGGTCLALSYAAFIKLGIVQIETLRSLLAHLPVSSLFFKKMPAAAGEPPSDQSLAQATAPEEPPRKAS